MDRIPETAAEQQNQTGEAMLPPALQFETLKTKMNTLVNEWNAEKLATERRRKIRKIEVDMETLRANGRLKPDEVLIGVRVIDENIKKEQPNFINYLTQSRRLAVFDCRSNPLISGIEILEQEFTKGMSYDGMMRNLFKTVDGAQTHGWDSVEITYDESKPLKCGIEHVGHENLLFPIDAKDLQACEFVMRRFKLSVQQLQRFVKKHGFKESAVNVAIEAESRANATIPKNLDVYKIFIKVDDIVYVAWAILDKNVSEWIKDPSPLSLGRIEEKQQTVIVSKPIQGTDPVTGVPTIINAQVPEVQTVQEPAVESSYPLKIYLYSESEEQSITEQKGRVFYDLPWQEAQIALRSLFINGSMRASNTYASPANRSDTGGAPRKMDLTLEPGCFYSEPMSFWAPNYPDPTMLRAADSLDVRKAAEMGQMASAVINRDDSRKTATELNKAESEQGKLNSVSILLFSGFMRGVLGVAWYIVQNQAQYNKVLIAPFEIAGPQGSQVVNNPMLINQVYDIKPAGDIDVVKRAERLEKRFQLFPIIQGFGGELFFEFTRDLIREMLPQDAEKYINLMGQDQQMKQALMATAGMLKEAVTDENGQLKPEFKEFAPQLQQLAQMGQQMMQQSPGQPQQQGKM
jgi:hypothetical protein